MLNFKQSMMHFYIRFYSDCDFRFVDLVELYLHFSDFNEEKFYCSSRPERAEALAILIELWQDETYHKSKKDSERLFTIS